VGAVQDASDAAGQNRQKPLAVGHERDGDDRGQGVGEEHPDAEMSGGVSGAGKGLTGRERRARARCRGGEEAGPITANTVCSAICAAAMAAAVRGDSGVVRRERRRRAT
jgi:hypothetical protein